MPDLPAVLTVTFNPALDLTVMVDALEPGAVHRVERTHRQAGGKGLNVSTLLALGGVKSVATGFLGQDNVEIFAHHLQRHGIEDAFVRVAGETRTGIKIVETGGSRTTDLNLPGLAPTAEHRRELLARIRAWARPDAWVVLAGSLPVGVEASLVAEAVAAARAGGAKVAADTSGPALAAAIAAGVDLAKPNGDELAELLGTTLADAGAILAAAQRLHATKVPHLVVSLGAEGAIFLAPDGALRAAAPSVQVVSTVGAGDSLLAGMLHGLLLGEDLEARARRATAYAWSRLEALVPTLPSGDALAARCAQVRVARL